ncbi:MAG: phage terminase large subunit family protein, partial [Deltaproteobacteria bacterium]|nr:phage terminase large subunit family protein [Deltaproteobacteria bacterium]
MPPPRYDPASWAAARRVLSSAESANPGRWDPLARPYLNEPLARLALHDPCMRLVLLFASQMGKSEIGNNWLGYVVDHAPCSFLLLRPTLDDCKGYSKQRLRHLFDCPALRGKVAEPRARDSGNTLLDKTFPGGMLILAGANSAARLASWPIRCLFADEIDRYPPSAGAEGDPLGLAEKRLSDSGERAKELLTSTPTLAPSSRIQREYDESSQAHWLMPCPHCGCEIEMLWRTAAADGTETYRLQWDGDPGVDGPGFDVRYVCQECDAPIREHHKTAMLAAGHWVHTHPERRTRGYKINALAAPIGSVSWRILAAEWAKATALAKAGDTSALRVFVNTRLAEPWEDVIGETIDVRALLGRRENWGNTRETPLVPARATVLTSGVDVQGGTGRIECAVWAWGPTTERWLVGYYVLPGSVYDPGTWDSLDEIRLRDPPRVGGGTMRIAAMAVDSGFATDEVHRWTHPRRAAGVFAVKGLGGTGLLIYNPKAQRSEKRGRYRGTFHSVSTNATGDEWHSHLLIPPAEPPEAHKPGYVHLPDWVDEAW